MDGEGSFSGESFVALEELKLGASAQSRFLKQGYRIVGEHGHGAVKLCHWTKSALKGGEKCYKNTFYGIESHRCMQMTPSLPSCNYACNFCWRDHFGNKPTLEGFELDAPKDLFEGTVDAQLHLLQGYKGNAKVAYDTYLEATKPRHVAVSLNGEPTNYPHLGEFFEACHERGITTFLVTNGSNPDVLRAMKPLPTQIYLSVDAPNKEVFERLCNPLLPGLWERFNQTVDLFATLPTRTVNRFTLVKDWNMFGCEEEYAAILKRSRPMFVESKGYSWMGGSTQHLKRENMPTMDEIRAFTRRIAELTGYELVAEREDSRVTLLSRVGSDTKIPGLGGKPGSPFGSPVPAP
ncbi:MAG: 4-demethylwyosine synthase TYW1 [Euryarchaeota archaeon]|nr:4-demethylwyosine synthase TYW1 [Euryarchaeota archaeon]